MIVKKQPQNTVKYGMVSIQEGITIGRPEIVDCTVSQRVRPRKNPPSLTEGA